MPIDFPDSPLVNDTFTANGTTWIWTGEVWRTVGTTTAVGPTGPTGLLSADSPLVYDAENKSVSLDYSLLSINGGTP